MMNTDTNPANALLLDIIQQLGRVARHAEGGVIGTIALDIREEVVAFAKRPLLDALPIAPTDEAAAPLAEEADEEEVTCEATPQARAAFTLAYLSAMRLDSFLRHQSSYVEGRNMLAREAAIELASAFYAILSRLSSYRGLLSP